MGTTFYYWSNFHGTRTFNRYTYSDQYADAVTALNNGGFFTAYDGYYSPQSYNYILGRVLDGNGDAIGTDEVAVSAYGPDGSTRNAELATLRNGNVVSTYTVTSGASTPIGFRIFAPDGSLLGEGTTATGTNYSPDVAALATGGFVITYDHLFSSTDIDTYATIFNADGSVKASLVVDSGTYDTSQSAVATLKNGNFVVSYSRERQDGSGANDLVFQIFDANGGRVRSATLADGFGSAKVPGEMIGLQDGGFAIVYFDDGWAGRPAEVTLGIWNADGSQRTLQRAAQPLTVEGQRNDPTIAQLENGFLAVGWSNITTGNTEFSIWTPDGNAVYSGIFTEGSRNLNFAASANGVLSGLFTDTYGATDGDGTGVGSYNRTLTRFTGGDATASLLTGDNLRDTMSGSDGNDTLLGLGGDDSLSGNGGRDSIDGGAGDDLIYGGAGADTLIGGAGIDTLSYLSSVAAVTLDLATPGANTGDAAGDLVSGFELVQGTSYNDRLSGDAAANNIDGADGNDLLFGRAGADSLTGGYGNDTLDGGADNDRLDGGSNDDLLIGGLGADSLIGKDGVDTASYAGAAAAVTANLLAPAGNTGEAAGDTYSGVEGLIGSRFNDRLTGNTAANRLEGGLGNDTLDGGAANDTLIGGEGADWLTASAGYDLLTGGAAGDRFVFTSVSPQFDTISDFDRLQGDRIVLASAAFGGLTGLTAGTSFIAKGAPMATQSGPTVLYDTGTGLLSYDADGTGAGAATRIATLTGAPTLLASSFVFV
ncbi:calcium-binding protein [uncultured Methylobacterium sp.]|uniref:calcium-binding protein n=1 Tax=uncultured Methylobacterium sp. TaxID=157278 RepID=UPI0026036AFC|nr:calcium-binding protein [uncultured Methylobacterium sp.]